MIQVNLIVKFFQKKDSCHKLLELMNLIRMTVVFVKK